MNADECRTLTALLLEARPWIEDECGEPARPPVTRVPRDLAAELNADLDEDEPR